jgi:hypothetical protein
MVRMTFIVLMITFIFIFPVKAQDETNRSAKYLTWSALQLVPSPVFLHDGDEGNNRIVPTLRWQITPVNFSFRANKYVSPVQFFMINPVRRFSGSIEIFVQPEWSIGNFKYSRLGRFGISTGSRLNLPLSADGEYLSMSLGGKYNYRKSLDGGKNDFVSLEGGVYALYGMVGLQFNYNINARSNYNFGLYIKYF